MTTETDLAADQQRLAGITDLVWWDWFNEQISDCYDPWRDWLSHARFPHEGPLHDWLEYDIEAAIKQTDALRLATVRQTDTFAKQWASFRQHHENLDQRGKYRRLRYMIWRAAALTVLCQRDRFQDDTDAREARDKLANTMRWFWPDMTAKGDYHGGNFWRPKLQDYADGAQRLDPLAEFAAEVLLLTQRALAP